MQNKQEAEGNTVWTGFATYNINLSKVCFVDDLPTV